MDEKQATGSAGKELLERQAKYMWPACKNLYEEPSVLESGDGLRLRDIDGNEYLDFFGGILTISIGHCDSRITEPLKAQIDRLGHVSGLYPTIPIVDLAETLARITPGNLQQSFFTASGTEADETAVALAQIYTGSTELIALRHGYSGRSILAQSLTAHSSWRGVPTQIAGIKHALSPYCYRCPLGLEYPSCEVKCADDIEELIQTTTTGHIAGMLAEPIQGVGGFITPPKEYFQKAAAIVRKYGGVFISDEVQTGFGRTGGKMFGIEQYGVEPDIMTMAKGVANGMPLGVTIATPEIAAAWKKTTFSTYGGNPMSSAAANAVIGVIEAENLPDNCTKQGDRLRAGLEALQQRYPNKIGEVRGMGLMQAIEMVVDEVAGDRTPDSAFTGRLFEETKKRGLLIGKGGLYSNITRLSPPMTISESEIDEALRILGESFEALAD